MASIYPKGIDGFTQLPLVIDDVTEINSVPINRLRNVIVFIEKELGVEPSGSYDTVADRLDAINVTLEDGFGDSSHSSLSNIIWDTSGHTGTPDFIAGFDGSGNPTYIDLSAINVTDLSGELADPQKVSVSMNSAAAVGSRSTLNFIEGSNVSLTISDDAGGDEIDITINAIVGGGGAHASGHITGGLDEIDGDKLDIDWSPSNYIPSTTPAEADSVDNLTAHLYGIDQAFTTVLLLNLVTSENIAEGELLRINADGEVEKANANTGTVDDSRVVGSSVGSFLAAATAEIWSAPGTLIPVKFAAAPAAISNGSPVYLSTVSGEATLTPPTVTGSIVFLLGILQSADGVDTTPSILFQPRLIARN